MFQGVFNHGLPFVGRHFEDLQITPVRFVADACQMIVGGTEYRCRKQLLAPAVAGKRAGLAQQMTDDMPEIDDRAAVAAVARQLRHFPRPIQQNDAVLVNACQQLRSDQPAGNRIPQLAHADRAVVPDGDHQFPVIGQILNGRLPHGRQFLAQTLRPEPVGRLQHPDQKPVILVLAAEITAAAQQQVLADAPLQMPVGALAIAVFLRPPHVDRARLDAVMRANPQVLRVETTLRAILFQLVGGRRGVVGEQAPRHPAQPPQRSLQATPQRQRRLAVRAHRPLPVRIRQHRVEQLVRQHLAFDHDAQIAHVGPVHRQLLAGLVVLREKHLLLRSFRQTPAPHTALERPQQLVLDPARMALRQILEKHLGLQFRCLAQHGQGTRPDLFQRVFPRPPGVRRLPLFHHVVLPQIIARRCAGHARLDCTHADVCSLVALANELGELGSFDHNPEQHPPPQPVSNGMPSHPKKLPSQLVSFNCRRRAVLIVVAHAFARVLPNPLISP